KASAVWRRRTPARGDLSRLAACRSPHCRSAGQHGHANRPHPCSHHDHPRWSHCAQFTPWLHSAARSTSMRRSVFLCCLAAAFLAGLAAAQGTAPPPDPRTVKLAGGRFAPLTYEQMTPEQKKAFETLLNGPRRSAAGPFNIMLRNPEFTNAAQLVGLEVRY